MRRALQDRILAGVATGVSVAWNISPRDEAPPRVVLWQIGGTRETAVDGVTGMRTALVQVDCWGGSYAEAVGLADDVSGQLDGWISAGDKIHAVLPENDVDRDPTTDTDDRLFRITLTYTVIYWV